MKSINKKARFDYQISEKIESGIVLSGPEAKSAKLNQVDLTHAYVKFRPSKFGGQEAWLIGLHIYPYLHADNTKMDKLTAGIDIEHVNEFWQTAIIQITSQESNFLVGKPSLGNWEMVPEGIET